MTSFTEDWIVETNLTQNKTQDKTDGIKRVGQKTEINKESKDA